MSMTEQMRLSGRSAIVGMCDIEGTFPWFRWGLDGAMGRLRLALFFEIDVSWPRGGRLARLVGLSSHKSPTEGR
jgi:hypothetical protein